MELASTDRQLLELSRFCRTGKSLCVSSSIANTYNIVSRSDS